MGRPPGPISICKVEDCSDRARSLGWCFKHYGRWKRNGDPLLYSPNKIPLIERSWRYIQRDDNGCWIWTGSLRRGYGSIGGDDGKRKFAHRALYEILVGPIPDGLKLDHLCRTLACVNPAHLEPVTQAENVRRGKRGVLWEPKAHCRRGHEYTGANLIVTKQGSRMCRTCRRMLERERRAKKRAA